MCIRLSVTSVAPVLCTLAATLLLSVSATAHGQQTPPPADGILQEIGPDGLRPIPPSLDFSPRGSPLTEDEPGGPTVQLTGIRFTGNTVFHADTLINVLAGGSGDTFLGKPYDLSELRAFANRISLHYRNNGFIFARAMLPAQRLADGELVIHIVEGRYGRVDASGDAGLLSTTQGFLRALEPGALIESASLERVTLLLGDLPGLAVAPLMQPGTESGTGDLSVGVSAARRINSTLRIDNHGSRFSGEYRGRATVAVNRVLVAGDEVTLSGLYSSEKLWLGQLGYAMPLGYRGLTGRISHARTSYDLASPFDGFTGTARVTSAGLTYPLIRSQRSNLIATVSYEYKDLSNAFQGVSFEEKTSAGWPLGVQFDTRDGLGAGGITYGSVTLTPGSLKSDVADAAKGSYIKTDVQLARIQQLTGGFSFFSRLSAQWSNTELDASESFTLGGANGVRSYPQGEGSGSRGALGQVEVRYGLGHLSHYLFYDAGRIAGFGDEQRRSIGGAGYGLRFNRNAWSLDGALAWQTWGGDALSDARRRDPRAWLSGAYRF